MFTSNTDLVFNVAQLLKEPVGATRKLELDTPSQWLNLGDEEAQGGVAAPEARNVHGHVKATKLSDGLLVQGDVEANVAMACSRCLDELLVPVEATLEEQFQPVVDVETGRPMKRAEDEVDDQSFSLDPNHLMDLTEPVRQALLVALPMKPLCREDCAGLCPQCGANWNEGRCDCESEEIDNRWAGLRELKLEDLPAGDVNNN